MKSDEELKATMQYAVLVNGNGFYVKEVSEYDLKFAQRTAADYSRLLLTEEEICNLSDVLAKTIASKGIKS